MVIVHFFLTRVKYCETFIFVMKKIVFTKLIIKIIEVFSSGVNLILKYLRTSNSRFFVKLKVFILQKVKVKHIIKKSLIYIFWVEVF